MKEDGSLDFVTLTEDSSPEQKSTFIKNATDCRTQCEYTKLLDNIKFNYNVEK